MTKVLVRGNAQPPLSVAIDGLILIKGAEIRPAWQRHGVLAEEMVTPGLAGKELVLNFPTRKRKHTMEPRGRVAVCNR